MYFNPIKVLMPLALWIFFFGFVKGVVDIARCHFRPTTSSLLLLMTGLMIGSIACWPTSSCDPETIGNVRSVCTIRGRSDGSGIPCGATRMSC